MNIFEELKLNNMVTKNRLVRSATWESLASPEGFLNDELYDIYEELAKGGVGIIVTGLTDVSPYNWSLEGNMRLCSDVLIGDYEKLTKTVHKHNCRILSEINMDEYVRVKKSIEPISIDNMTADDIKDAINLFVSAAVRAQKANFDGVQLHLAYGWFLNRFINPVHNHRTDSYGGSTENRCRIVKEIIEGIKNHAPTLHISAKFTFFDNIEGEFAIDECINICKNLEAAGLDSIEILGGHSEKEEGTKFEACYLDLGLAVKKEVTMPVILTGNNHDLSNMETLAKSGAIDMIAISRPLIREPNLPLRWMQGDESPAKCISCSMCYKTHGKRCIFNVRKSK